MRVRARARVRVRVKVKARVRVTHHERHHRQAELGQDLDKHGGPGLWVRFRMCGFKV